MAIYTFSTKSSKPDDEQLVTKVKNKCEQRCMNFSGLVLKLLKEWEEADDKQRKV